MTPDQHATLARIDTNVGHLLNGQADHEKRLRGLERTRNWAIGVLAAIGAIFGYKFNPLL